MSAFFRFLVGVLLVFPLIVPVAAQKEPSAPAAAKGGTGGKGAVGYRPGLGSWTMFRGDFEGTGFSYSPPPAFKGIKWKYFTGGPVSGAPVLFDGKIVVVTEEGTVHAIDQEKGVRIWTTILGRGGVGSGAVHTSPLIFKGRIYTATRSGELYCLRLADGKQVWYRKLTRKRDQVASPTPIYASPKGDERGILMPTMGAQVYCLDPGTGETRWQFDTRREIGSTPIIMGNTVFLPTKGRRVLEIDYKTGSVRRQISLPGTTHCSPATGMGFLFLTLGGNRCVGVDLVPPLPGEEAQPIRWNIEARGQARNAMAFYDGMVMVQDGATLRAVSASSGQTIWRADLSYKLCDPAITKDLVIGAVRNGYLHAWKRKDGKEIWTLKLPYKCHQGPVLVDGVIYQATIDNYLVAIE